MPVRDQRGPPRRPSPTLSNVNAQPLGRPDRLRALRQHQHEQNLTPPAPQARAPNTPAQHAPTQRTPAQHFTAHPEPHQTPSQPVQPHHAHPNPPAEGKVITESQSLVIEDERNPGSKYTFTITKAMEGDTSELVPEAYRMPLDSLNFLMGNGERAPVPQAGTVPRPMHAAPLPVPIPMTDGQLISAPHQWTGRADSKVFTTDESGRMSMRGQKRPGKDQEDGTSKASRPDVSIRDVHFQSNWRWYIMSGEKIVEEAKITRAYLERNLAQLRSRREVYRGQGWTTSKEESRTLGQMFDIGEFPVAEFRANLTEPDEECLDWWPCKQGIIIVKFRPCVICENADYGLRVRPCTCFGDSDARKVKIIGPDGKRTLKIADYVQLLLWPSNHIAAEKDCFRGPIYFYPVVDDYDFSKDDRFAHAFTHYIHLHSISYRKLGRVRSLRDMEAVLELEKASASRMVKPMEEAIAAHIAALERDNHPNAGFEQGMEHSQENNLQNALSFSADDEADIDADKLMTAEERRFQAADEVYEDQGGTFGDSQLPKMEYMVRHFDEQHLTEAERELARRGNGTTKANGQLRRQASILDFFEKTPKPLNE